MRTITHAARLAALALASLALAACAGGAKGTDTASMGLANSKCPMMPQDPIDPKVTVKYKGEKVAFCCPGCIGEWNSLSDADKDARLAKSR
jgi:hypothetical protein